MMRKLIPLLLLTSCAAQTPSVQIVKICPTLVTYTSHDQDQMATELSSVAPSNPEIVRWVGDYIGLRDQVKACKK